MKLHNLKPAKGATKSTKRIGRGEGSGHGGTSTRGHNGQKSRSGYSRKIGFEGGQMPLQRRVPKFGFTNINRVDYKAVNLSTLQKLADEKKLVEVNQESLMANGLVSKNDLVKVLGHGELKAKITVTVHAYSQSAKSAIEAAGGEVPDNIIEGHSIKPLLNGKNPKDWRKYVVSESNYAAKFANWEFNIKPSEARGTMIRTKEWKYIHHEAFRPELYDLKKDPEELHDLGEDPAYENIRRQMQSYMFESLRRRKTHTTYSDKKMEIRARNSLDQETKGPVGYGKW